MLLLGQHPHPLRINKIESPLNKTLIPLLLKYCLTVCMLPSLAIGSMIMEVGSMISVMVVVIAVTLLVVEDAVSVVAIGRNE